MENRMVSTRISQLGSAITPAALRAIRPVATPKPM